MQNGRITGELGRSEATEEAILGLAMADDLAPVASDRPLTDSADGDAR